MHSSHWKIPMQLCSITIAFSEIDYNSPLHFKSPMWSEFGEIVFTEKIAMRSLQSENRHESYSIYLAHHWKLAMRLLFCLYIYSLHRKRSKVNFNIYYKDSPISDCYVASPEVYRTHYKNTIYYLVSMRYTTTLL